MTIVLIQEATGNPDRPLVALQFTCYGDLTFAFFIVLNQAQQVVYTVDPAGNVMAQRLDGVPVAVPAQARDGMVDMPPFGAQEGQFQMVLVPVSGAADGQVLIVQYALSAAMPAADHDFLPQE